MQIARCQTPVVATMMLVACNAVLGIEQPIVALDGGAVEGDGGSGDGHVVTGDAAGTDAAPAGVPIASLRKPDSDVRAAALAGDNVTIAGAVVTNVKRVGPTNLFFVQDPGTPEWGGLAILSKGDPGVVRGDLVTVTGKLRTYKGLDELDTTTTGSYTRTGKAPLPTPVDVAVSAINATGVRRFELQSVLGRVRTVKTAVGTGGSGLADQEFSVSEVAGGPTLIVTSYYVNDIGVSPFPSAVGDAFLSITGNAVTSALGSETPEGKLAPGAAIDLNK
jgi:hypothetical protein